MSLFCPIEAECKNDAAVEVLSNIYGRDFIHAFISGGINPAAATPAAGELAPIILGGLATVAGMLAIVVFFCLIFTTLISSAQDGEAFGKGSAKSVIVIRFLFSIMMLMPTGSQYCLAQIVLMAFVLWSNGETNKLYHKVVSASTIASVPVPTTNNSFPEGADPMGLRTVAAEHFRQAYCVSLLNKNYYSSRYQALGEGNLQLSGVNIPASNLYLNRSPNAINAYTQKNIKVPNNSYQESHIVSLMDDGGALTSKSDYPVCGTLRINIPKGFSPNVKPIESSTVSEALGLTTESQEKVSEEIGRIVNHINNHKLKASLKVTAVVSNWLTEKDFPFDYTTDAISYENKLKTVDFDDLNRRVEAEIKTQNQELARVIVNSNLPQLTQSLVKAITLNGWTYAGGIKQRIMNAQSGYAEALNNPAIVFAPPSLEILNVEDERRQKYEAAIAVLDTAMGRLSSNIPSNTTNLDYISTAIPTKFDKDTSMDKVTEEIEDSYGNFLTAMQKDLISWLVIGDSDAGSITKLQSNSANANWLMSEKDVLSNIQQTGNVIAVFNGVLNVSVKAVQAKMHLKSGATHVLSENVGGGMHISSKAFTDVIVPIIAKILTYLSILQVYMAVIIPSMPYFFFITAVVAWYIHILQAMAGIPFWAIMHMIPERSFVGSQTQGYITVIALFLRPLLTLTGLFFGFILANPILVFVTDAFFTMQASMVHRNEGFFEFAQIAVSIFTFFNWLLVYCTLVLQICYMIFGLAGTLPDTVLRWLGSGLNAGGWGESNAQKALESGASSGSSEAREGVKQMLEGKPKDDDNEPKSIDPKGPSGSGGSGNIASPTSEGVDAKAAYVQAQNSENIASQIQSINISTANSAPTSSRYNNGIQYGSANVSLNVKGPDRAPTGGFGTNMSTGIGGGFDKSTNYSNFSDYGSNKMSGINTTSNTSVNPDMTYTDEKFDSSKPPKKM